VQPQARRRCFRGYGADVEAGTADQAQVLHLDYIDCLLQCPPAEYSFLTSSSMLRSLTWGDYE